MIEVPNSEQFVTSCYNPLAIKVMRPIHLLDGKWIRFDGMDVDLRSFLSKSGIGISLVKYHADGERHAVRIDPARTILRYRSSGRAILEYWTLEAI